MIQKCIITGGAGFIGSHLADLLLEKDFEVEIIDNLSTGRKDNINHLIKKVKFHEFDLSENQNYLTEILKMQIMYFILLVLLILYLALNIQKFILKQMFKVH